MQLKKADLLQMRTKINAMKLMIPITLKHPLSDLRRFLSWAVAEVDVRVKSMPDDAESYREGVVMEPQSHVEYPRQNKVEDGYDLDH